MKRITLGAVGAMLFCGPFLGAVDTRGAALKKEPLAIGESLTMRSAVLDEDRTIQVVLPQGYDGGTKAYPVLYLLDAEWHLLQAAGAVKYLSETSYLTRRAAPEMIVVGIVNVNRDRDFTPTDGKRMATLWTTNVGKAESTVRFLRDELMPLVDSSYRTSGYDVIAGWSYGGLFSVFTLFRHPGLFDGGIAISPALWWDEDWLVDEICETWDPAILEKRSFVMTVGEREKTNLIYGGIRALADFLSAESPAGTFTFLEVPSADHNASPLKAFPLALEALFGDLDVPGDVIQAGFPEIVEYCEGKSRKYNTPVRVPWHLYDAYGRHYLKQGKVDEALELYRRRAEEYPESSGALAAIGDVYREQGDQPRAIEWYEWAIEMERARETPDVRVIEHNEQVIAELRSAD